MGLLSFAVGFVAVIQLNMCPRFSVRRFGFYAWLYSCELLFSLAVGPGLYASYPVIHHGVALFDFDGTGLLSRVLVLVGPRFVCLFMGGS